MADHKTEIEVDVESRDAKKGAAEIADGLDEAADSAKRLGANVEDALKKLSDAQKALDALKKKAKDDKEDSWLQRLLKRIPGIAQGDTVASVKSGNVTPMMGLATDIGLAGGEEIQKDIKSGKLNPGLLGKLGLGLGVTAVASIGAGIGIGMGKQAALSQRVGQLESSLAFAHMAGVGPGNLTGAEGQAWMGKNAAMGFTPEQSVEMVRAYAAAAGHKVRNPSDYMRLALSGAGVGAIGGYDEGKAPGRNVFGGSAERVLGMAFAQGFRGSGLDKILSQTAEMMVSIGARGVKVNADNFERFMGRMQATRGLQDVGERGDELMRGFVDPALGVKDQMLSPFKSIGEALIKARIYSGGGGIKGILSRADKYATDPALGWAAIRNGGLGRDMTDITMQAMTGVTADRAAALSNLSGSPDYGRLEQVDPASRERLRVDAERQARTIGRVQDVEAYEAQSRAAEMLESAALTLGKVGTGLLKVIGDLL